MRKSLLVSLTNRHFSEENLLISTSYLKGRIVSCNQHLVEDTDRQVLRIADFAHQSTEQIHVLSKVISLSKRSAKSLHKLALRYGK